MRNQFYYTVVQEGKEEVAKVTASFAIDKVIRTIEYEPGKTVVLLDDFHEEQGKRPVQGQKGKITMATFKETVYSSIYLSEEDSKRYRSLTEIQAVAGAILAEETA